MIRSVGEPGDLGWVIKAHGEVYAAEYGWDATFETMVCRIVADWATGHDPEREAGWIAEVGGRRAGCVFCVDAHENDTAVLRVLLVDWDARGHGVGGRLVDTCLDFARTAGYARMRLWTTHPLTAARSLYLSRGFELTAEEPRRTFGADLIGQTYERAL